MLSDEHYCCAARRDIALPPSQDAVLPHRCGACRQGLAADGRHGQRCIYISSFRKLRYDSIERLLHSTIRDGIGQAASQPHNLPGCRAHHPQPSHSPGQPSVSM